MGDSPIEDFFAQYEDLALAVIQDDKPYTALGINMSNADMVECVCDIMDWEGFDLFDEYAFEMVYKTEKDQMIRAFCYIAFLRRILWLHAQANGIGDTHFNVTAAAHDELWYLKLRDRCNALRRNQDTNHTWLQ